jgi:hypothetical protein
VVVVTATPPPMLENFFWSSILKVSSKTYENLRKFLKKIVYPHPLTLKPITMVNSGMVTMDVKKLKNDSVILELVNMDLFVQRTLIIQVGTFGEY